MTEKELLELMRNIDNDLIQTEIDELTSHLDIDLDAISQKAEEKLQKECLRMKKRRRYPLVAALIAVLGASVVYASDINEFFRASFSNQREIYSSVVEGDAFYLEEAVRLNDDKQLGTVIFTKDELTLEVNMEFGEDLPDISIEAGDVTYLPGGYGKYDENIVLLSFYNANRNDYTFFPQDAFTLNIEGKSHLIQLSQGDLVIEQGEILPVTQQIVEDDAEAMVIDWLNLGIKELENGVQILASFTDTELELTSIGEPVEETFVSTAIYDGNSVISNSTSTMAKPLIGYDNDGNAYEFITDQNGSARPITLFESTAPKGAVLDVRIPSVLLSYDFRKEFPSLDILIPELGDTANLHQEIDFQLQKMVLNSIERTSPTTARLLFDLNTGDKHEVSLRGGLLHANNVQQIDSVWEGDTCEVILTFKEDTQNINLSINVPDFVVKGNWSFVTNVANELTK